MDLHKTILFYSKNSKSSNNILQLIDTCGNNIREILNYRLISVDSKSIRKQILNNPTIKIQHVPCLIKIYNNGTVEQYNYKELHQLIEYTIKLHKEEQLKQQPPPVIKQQRPIVPPTIESESEDTEIEEIPMKPKKKPKMKPKKKPKQEKVKVTTIDSDDEPETESENEHNKIENYTTTNTEKPTAKKQKSDDLMLTAMQMQKERETNDGNMDIKSIPRVGPV